MDLEHLEYIGTTVAWLVVSLSILVAYGSFAATSYARLYDLTVVMLRNFVKSSQIREGETACIKLGVVNTGLLRICVVSRNEIAVIGIDGRNTSIMLPEGAEIDEDHEGELCVHWRA